MKAPSGQPLIDIRHCSIYRGKKILDDISLQIEKFQHTAILGPNGSGKSTLIRLLMRELYPSQQEDTAPYFKIFERDDFNLFEIRRTIAYVSPKLSEQLLQSGSLDVFDAVASAFFGSYGFFGGDQLTDHQARQAREILETMRIDDLAAQAVNILSTGQLRKVLIARAMLLAPGLILLDEPMSGLDVAAQHDFQLYLGQVAHAVTILLVTHHLEEIIPAIENIVLLKDGKIFKQGPKEKLLTENNLSELFGTAIKLDLSQDGIYTMRKY